MTWKELFYLIIDELYKRELLMNQKYEIYQSKL